MRSGNLLIICGVLLAGLFILVSFKGSVNETKKLTIFRQYLSADVDFGNFIVVTYPDGKSKKQALLQNKPINYEMNEKMFNQVLNDLTNNGFEIKHVTSSGDSHLTITTFILQ